jgi:type IV pilus assembly protein PilM
MAVGRTIGLDIGAGAVKLVELNRSKRGYELAYAGMAYLPDGAIVEKSIKKTDAVGHAIGGLYKNSQSRCKMVSTSLSGRSVIVKQVIMGSMTDQQLEKQIQMEAEPYIPFDIKEVYLDFFIMGDRPEKEGQMDVVLVAVKKDYMDEVMALVGQQGLTANVVDVDPFALEVMYEFCYPNVQEEVVALVNVGASSVNINFLKQGASQYTRDLTSGVGEITKEIMRFFEVDYERAENIKRGASLDDVNGRHLRRIFQRSVGGMITEFQKVLDFFSQNISYDPIQKIFLSGGGANTYGLRSEMEQDLNIPVEIVDPFRSLSVDEKVFDLDYLNSVGPTMALAVGLALREEQDKQV